jgi:hypothetical protein
MKTKRLGLISCFAAAALIASPALGDMHKKSAATSMSKPQRMTARTTQVTPTYCHGISSRMGGTGGYYAGNRYYTGYAGYYGGTRYYYGVIDGVMGPRTRAAVAAYESRHGLAVDGTISAPLLDRLGLA